MSQDGGGSDAGDPEDAATEDAATGDTATGDGREFPTVEGEPIDAAVDAIVEADDDRDRDAVGQALSRVTEDGVVRESAVTDALAHLSKVVSTPETRVELAASALDDARESADPVTDLAVVRSRLDAYEAAVADLDDRIDALRASLRAVVERRNDPDSLYAIGRDVQRVTDEANAVQQRADELQVELSEFESWLDDPDVRAGQLAQDAATVETTLDDLDDVAAALEQVEHEGTAAGKEADDDGATTVSVPGSVEITDPAVAWVDTAFRQRVLDLLLADLRAELADLRTWADREGADADELDDVAGGLDSLDERVTDLGDRLDALARPAWTDRFGDRLASFDARVDDEEPPVDWGDVEATLAEYRSSLLGES